MQESTSAHPPEGPGRRAWLPRRSATPRPTEAQQPVPVVVSLERSVEERLSEGLRTIEEQAAALMREIASEVWRASGADTSEVKDRILTFLSRDQAIRSLIASSDERFQALSVRAARFEDALTGMVDSGRATREAVKESAAMIRKVAESPAVQGVETIRNQLEFVEHHIAATFQHLDERDRELVDGIQSRIQEHGKLVARETTRIVEAMQGYVESGAEAVGRLAERVETHAEAFAVHDDDVAERLRGVIRDEMGDVTERLELTAERAGIDQRDARHALGRLEQEIEARVFALAQLVRSDSEALRGHIERTAAAQQDRMSAQIETRVSALARAAEEQVSALTLAVSAMVERQLAALSQNLDERLGGVDGSAGRSADDVTGDVTGTSLEDRLAAHVDERINALAKLIRSDNRVIAQALTRTTEEDQPETAKQTLRAVKELHASLAGEVDRRFQTMADQLHRESQSTVETMAKLAEVLAGRMDRVSAKIDETYGNDLPVAIERMSDAISAISALSRRQ